ncbi:Uncharacterized protein OS=Tolypothrix bouteillei VB521301 GN=DA73_48470 PE=4 SV=1: Phage_sheath_1 [Gemmata massiliana]|uniref:Tail sheath protein C-terminal domain-containing protein n=1 Tax=Gemmata massiliana TaxID=1210884 RepID=A0A6P2CYQ9_9BACT|nr:phage tail sheath C-terminal domain-containing protein [Gemmata massiliana]VTR92924.1 Uncharacterized protein OS=Tolypothrix bouteillei VB521301 GN=DA73_48470 PE=4 SV=1: Phage_sheath_1 [Gemmata massiliana]
MAVEILPGVYVNVRAEGLISPPQVTVNNIGIVGTASKGALNTVVLLGSYAEAVNIFGPYNAFERDTSTKSPKPDALTLVRSLQLAYDNGASTVYAVRISQQLAGNPVANPGKYVLGTAAELAALSPGEWGNGIAVNVADAKVDAFIDLDSITAAAGVTAQLGRTTIDKNNKGNRIRVVQSATKEVKSFGPVYSPALVASGKVLIDPATGALTFDASEPLQNGDKILASYGVPAANSVLVTLRLGNHSESYTAADGNHLVALVNGSSQLATAVAGTAPDTLPPKSNPISQYDAFGSGANQRGTNGAAADASDYANGLALLLDQPVHLTLTAGQDSDSIGSVMRGHLQQASTSLQKGERIGILGSNMEADLNEIRAKAANAADDEGRIIFVGPGVGAIDTAVTTGDQSVLLPGSYAAAAVAGMLAAREAEVSLTNKVLTAQRVEKAFTAVDLQSLVQGRVLALEQRSGVRVVKAITTSTNTAWAQITTRRIVDYAIYGVRGAASPYIGLLNNTRVRGNLKSTLDSFLQRMVEDEMLVDYRLDVTATRQEEIQGVVQVVMTLLPTFSIDYIRVTMFLS